MSPTLKVHTQITEHAILSSLQLTRMPVGDSDAMIHSHDPCLATGAADLKSRLHLNRAATCLEGLQGLLKVVRHHSFSYLLLALQKTICTAIIPAAYII